MPSGGDHKPKGKRLIKKDEELLAAIPEYLVNQPLPVKEAYLKWNELDKKIHEHKDRFQDIIDPENPDEFITIDLIQAIPVIRKKINHLPKEEQELIISTWKKIQGLKTKKGHLKKIWNNANKKGSGKSIFDLKKTEILELFGRFYTIKELLNVIRDDWGYLEITEYDVQKFYNRHLDKIKTLREKWEAELSDFPLVKKRGRVEQLSYLYRQNKEKYEDNDHSLSFSKELRAIIEQIRKEVEGDRIMLDINQNIDVSITMQANKSILDISRELSVNTLIVAMVAARRNINPLQLLAELQTSFYSKYSGFSGNITKDEIQDNNYFPSKIAYDWLMIDKSNAVTTQYEEIETGIPDEKRKSKVTSDREKLLNLLNKKSIDMKKSIDKVNKKNE